MAKHMWQCTQSKDSKYLVIILRVASRQRRVCTTYTVLQTVDLTAYMFCMQGLYIAMYVVYLGSNAKVPLQCPIP